MYIQMIKTGHNKVKRFAGQLNRFLIMISISASFHSLNPNRYFGKVTVGPDQCFLNEVC